MERHAVLASVIFGSYRKRMAYDANRFSAAKEIDGPGLGQRFFVITKDQENRCLRIVVSGLWLRQTSLDYISDLRAKTGEMMKLGKYKGAIVDAEMYPIQTQLVASAHANAMRLARTMYGVKASMLTSQSRSKLQMRRMATETGQRAFDCREEALNWLLT